MNPDPFLQYASSQRWEDEWLKKKKKNTAWDFPGSPEVKTPPSHCSGCRFNPGQGTKIPHATVHSQKNKQGKKKKHHGKNAVYQLSGLYGDRDNRGPREASSLSRLCEVPTTLSVCLSVPRPGPFQGAESGSPVTLPRLFPHHHSATASLAAPCSSILCLSFSSPHLLTIFRVVTRGRKMIHLGSHLSIAWARKLLGPVSPRVHPPLMHIMEKALALKPDGPGVPTQALSTLYQQQTSHALRVVAKRHCNTMWYITRHRAEPRFSSLLLQWLLNHLFTSKDNLSFSTQLLPGLQLSQRKCCFTGTLNFTNGSYMHSA